jgi:hypothetical protein
MPWRYIYELLGPGPVWGRSPEELRALIARAERDNRQEAAEHFRIMLRLRNRVMMSSDRAGEEKDPQP